jgi:LacI family transcriptional regulator
MAKKISLKDIASQLGVSVALVSYVLNGKMSTRINADTAARIRNLAKELNYTPNQIAISLKNSKTFTIGLIVADISNIFYSTIANFIEEEANQFGYNVLFGSAYENHLRFQSLLEVFIAKQVDGLILAVPEKGEQYLERLTQVNIPFVILDREFDSVESHKIVNIDNYQASQEVVSHLYHNGFKKIGAIALVSSLIHLSERKKGFTDTVKDLMGIKKPSLYEIVEHELDQEIERVVLDAIQVDKVDALYFLTSRIAMAGLSVLARHNINVPEQVGVVCFDESDAYRIFKKELTFVKQPLQLMSKRAVQLILASTAKPVASKFATTLIVRESSLKPVVPPIANIT